MNDLALHIAVEMRATLLDHDASQNVQCFTDYVDASHRPEDHEDGSNQFFRTVSIQFLPNAIDKHAQ